MGCALVFTVPVHASESSGKGIPVPPPDLVLHQSQKVPALATVAVASVYGGALGSYLGLVTTPMLLGSNHGQPGAAASGSLIGFGLGAGLGAAYGIVTDGRLDATHSLIHYSGLGFFTGLGFANFFGNRGAPFGAAYSGGMIGTVGGTLLGISLEASGLVDHGSMLWGTYAGLLAGVGGFALSQGVGMIGEATLGTTLAATGVTGLFTSLALVQSKPDPIRAGAVFTTGAITASAASILVGGLGLFLETEDFFGGGDAAQAFAAFSGACIGAVFGNALFDWGALRWMPPQKQERGWRCAPLFFRWRLWAVLPIHNTSWRG